MNPMNSGPIQSSSSHSEGSDLRYQKAVKQISKLIAVNTNFRKQLDQLNLICQDLQARNKMLLRDCETLSKDRKFLEEKSRNLERELQKIREEQENANRKSQNYHSEKMVADMRGEFKREIEDLEDKLNQQGNTIIKFEERVTEKQKENFEMKTQLLKYEEELQKQRNTLTQWRNEEDERVKKKFEQMRCPNCLKKKERDEAIMEWNKKVSEENVNLHKKIALLQLQKSSHHGQEIHRFCDLGPQRTGLRVRTQSVSEYFQNSFHERLRELQTSQKKDRVLSLKKMSKMEREIKKLKHENQNKKIRQKLTRSKLTQE